MSVLSAHILAWVLPLLPLLIPVLHRFFYLKLSRGIITELGYFNRSMESARQANADEFLRIIHRCTIRCPAIDQLIRGLLAHLIRYEADGKFRLCMKELPRQLLNFSTLERNSLLSVIKEYNQKLFPVVFAFDVLIAVFFYIWASSQLGYMPNDYIIALFAAISANLFIVVFLVCSFDAGYLKFSTNCEIFFSEMERLVVEKVEIQDNKVLDSLNNRLSSHNNDLLGSILFYLERMYIDRTKKIT